MSEALDLGETEAQLSLLQTNDQDHPPCVPAGVHCRPPHQQQPPPPPPPPPRPAGRVHVCFSEADTDFSLSVVEDLQRRGHDVTDCERSPLPGLPELRQAATLVQGATWVVVVVSPEALDSIWLHAQLQWALDVAVSRGTSHVILLMPPDVDEIHLPLLLEFFPPIWAEGETWVPALSSLVSGSPDPLSLDQRRQLKEQAFLCGPQTRLWPTLSTPSLDWGLSQDHLDSRFLVPPSQQPRVSHREQERLLTSKEQAVGSLQEDLEASSGHQRVWSETQQPRGEADEAGLHSEGPVHFIHTEEDTGLVADVMGWLEERGVRCTDGGLSVRPGLWELPQLETLVTSAAWVVVMVTLGSLDSTLLEFLCQVAALEAARRDSGNVVVVLARPRLQGLLPRVLSPFTKMVAAADGVWRSRLKELVTSRPPPLSRAEGKSLREEAGGEELAFRRGGLQSLWRAASAWSLERGPASHSGPGSLEARPILPLWQWPKFTCRRRKAQLGRADDHSSWEGSDDFAKSHESVGNEVVKINIVEDEEMIPNDENAKVASREQKTTCPVISAALSLEYKQVVQVFWWLTRHPWPFPVMIGSFPFCVLLSQLLFRYSPKAWATVMISYSASLLMLDMLLIWDLLVDIRNHLPNRDISWKSILKWIAIYDWLIAILSLTSPDPEVLIALILCIEMIHVVCFIVVYGIFSGIVRLCPNCCATVGKGPSSTDVRLSHSDELKLLLLKAATASEREEK